MGEGRQASAGGYGGADPARNATAVFAADVFRRVALARKWLHKPHPSLDGMTPGDYADNELGAQQVRGLLAGLKYGGVAWRQYGAFALTAT